jgi:hypothetical protein
MLMESVIDTNTYFGEIAKLFNVKTDGNYGNP